MEIGAKKCPILVEIFFKVDKRKKLRKTQILANALRINVEFDVSVTHKRKI